MNRTVLLIAAASMLVAGCKGSRGRAGNDGPEGPAGPITDPPYIASVSPSSGSANTIWTITGANLGTSATVTFNGHEAAVLSATDTQLVVTDAFPPVDAIAAISVSIENADQVSNSHAVFGFPSGTDREQGEWRIWTTVADFAVSGTTWYVVDLTKGLYAFDTATRGITRVLSVDEPGMGSPIAVDAVGTDVYVTMENGAGIVRIFRRTAESWEQFTAPGVGALAIVDAGSNKRYVAGTSSIILVNQDGSADATFAFSAADEIGGLAVVGGALYVTYPNLNKVVSVDNAGVQTDFATTGLASPRATVSDGATGLYVLDSVGIQAVDNAGAVTLYSNQTLPDVQGASSYADLRGLVRLPGGELLVSDPSRGYIFRMDDATTGAVPVGGLLLSVAHARLGDETFYGDLDSCYESDPNELTEGVLLALSPTGARVVSTDYCAIYVLAPSGTDSLLLNAASLDAFAKSAVIRIDVTTGAATVLADETDGLVLPVASVEDTDGTVYVVNADATLQSSVYRIAPNGTVTPDYIAHAVPSGSDASIGLALSGGYLWATRLSDGSGITGGIYRASTATGGDWEAVYGETFLEVLPYFDAIIPDGNGGIHVADYISQAIVHFDAQGLPGHIVPIPVSGIPAALERDAATGDFIVTSYTGAVDPLRLMP